MPPPPRIRDSGDAGLVSSVLTDAALCVDCIVKKTGVPAPRVHAVLESIGRTVKVDSGGSLCSACMTVKRVFQLA
jgi:hypothetical protein